MDRSWMHKDRRSKDYESGVEYFLNNAVIHASDLHSIRCPCILCGNLKFQPITDIRNHLFFNGIDKSYCTWIWHGEAANTRASPFLNTEDGVDQEVDPSTTHDGVEAVEMVEAAYAHCTSDPNVFIKLIEDAEKPLLPGCKKYTKLSALVRMFKFKANNGLSDKGFSDLLTMMGDFLPDRNEIPPSVYEAKKSMAALGMGYEKIHACSNDCILYRNEFKDANSCPTCKTSRWKLKKNSTEPRIGVPAKVLWYFPSILRFLKMFQLPKTSKGIGLCSEEGKGIGLCILPPGNTPFSSAYLSGRKRESDASNLLGAVSKLFILCAKYVYRNLSSLGASATLQTCLEETSEHLIGR